jgi:hypothetical protein
MKRTVTAIGATLGTILMLTASSAHAQQYAGEPYDREFGHKGQFIISADRLVPFFAYTHDSIDNGGDKNNTAKITDSTTQTSMSFFYGYTAAARDIFYTVPRVGFDYTIINNVTIGGEIVLYFTLGGNDSEKTELGNNSNTVSTGSPTTTVFGIAPRGGYIFRFTNLFSLWARGGFSFYNESTNSQSTFTNNGLKTTQTVKTSDHVFSIDLDPQLVLTPLPNFGLTAGVTFDIPLGGGNTNETDSVATNGGMTITNDNKTSGGASAIYLGVTLGLFVHF